MGRDGGIGTGKIEFARTPYLINSSAIVINVIYSV